MTRILYRLLSVTKLVAVASAVTVTAQPTMTRTVIASGGGTGSNATTRVALTIAQPLVGLATATSHQISAGFWISQPPLLPSAVRDDLIAASTFGAVSALAVAPNPASTGATIRVTLSSSGRATMRLYDATGRTVRSLVDEERAAGELVHVLDVSTLAPGRYILEVMSGTSRQASSLIILR